MGSDVFVRADLVWYLSPKMDLEFSFFDLKIAVWVFPTPILIS